MNNMNYTTPPFGPLLVHFEDINPELLSKSLDLARSEPEYYQQPHVASKIENVYRYDLFEDVKEVLAPMVMPYIKKYIDVFLFERINPVQLARMEKFIDHRSLSFEFTGMWLNKQRRLEYNSPHTHSGDISFVYYPYIPEEIAHEEPFGTGVGKGQIVFQADAPHVRHADWDIKDWLACRTAYTVQPKTGDMFIFPSWLQHWVECFQTDTIRYSVSGNIFIDYNLSRHGENFNNPVRADDRPFKEMKN
jgi:hypothetical protein